MNVTKKTNSETERPLDDQGLDEYLELEKAKNENHFSKKDLETVPITGDLSSKGVEWHIIKCRNIIALCEMYDIRIVALGVYGSIPIALIDVKPSLVHGSEGKWKEISEFPIHGQPGKTVLVANFDVTVWGVPAKERLDYRGIKKGDWEIEI